MIARLIQRVFGKKTAATKKSRLQIIPLAQHGLARERILPCALKVTDTLQQGGFAAFVVGGAVRDLLLGKTPKDFDVATNATPEQVHALFRRSRIIGRRFRLVHVMCGGDTIEVSTFRSNGLVTEDDDDRATDATGRIVRDNVFGSQEDDAERRDFTINALYYDPTSQEIWDYRGGVADIERKTLRMIGDPATRYREDPVRMLRAARFAAKLEFKIDEATRAPVAELADLLENVPPSRLFDEMLKLLLSGHALRGVHQLRAEGLHRGMLPLLDTILEQPAGERFITAALHNTDLRVQAGKPVSPAFLFATLLWHELQSDFRSRIAAEVKPAPALFEAMDAVLDRQRERLAVPRRLDGMMKEIWSMQPRFEQRSGSRPYRLLPHPRFRAGYDFLLLRAQSGEVAQELGDWWTLFQDASEEARAAMLLPEVQGALKKRRRKRSKKPADAGEPASQA
ncbi:MAG: polynucleotide adenylyltransferase PcnB [Pseudomonadota bacterium]